MLYIGVMSGTSCDGVDVALVDCATAQRTVATFHQAYPESLRTALLDAIQGKALPVAASSELETRLSHFYAGVINQFLEQQQVFAKEVRAIGLHGQTVYHQPEPPHANTIQWGNPAVVTAQTGITTINQFRQLDVALGGQGAPLAPVLHQTLLQHAGRPAAVINLGGIANLTTIKGGELIGFDTGPANCLLDEWCQLHQGKSMDDQGHWAATGQVVPALLNQWLQDDYFQQPFPKSTGREHFNLKWLQSHLAGEDVRPEDVQRTLLALTVHSIRLGLQQTETMPEVVYLCGGGVHNQQLVGLLQEELSAEVKTTTVLGIDPDFVEATLMAWLAHLRITKQSLNLGSVTGASSAIPYGIITTNKP